MPLCSKGIVYPFFIKHIPGQLTMALIAPYCPHQYTILQWFCQHVKWSCFHMFEHVYCKSFKERFDKLVPATI